VYIDPAHSIPANRVRPGKNIRIKNVMRIEPQPFRVGYLALAESAIACLLCLWTAWCEFPVHSWNEARLIPAFALRDGVNPYPLIGGGPLFTWIYGPVGILINLPATFASSAAGALHLSTLLNFGVLIFPLAYIFWSSTDLRGRSTTVRWFALTLAVLLIPRPNLVFQVADHAAIAFGLLSCWWLVRRASPDNGRLGMAAVLCTFAIWSKQTTVFLVVAQLAYLFLTDSRPLIPRYLLWLAVANLTALGLSVLVFGWANLWLNLVAIPGRLPWTDDVAAKFALRPWSLIAQIGLPCLGLILLRVFGTWPARNSESSRFFLITVLAFFAMLPVGLAAFLKIGGDTNVFHSWDYLMPALLLIWLAEEKVDPGTRYRVLAVATCAVALRWTDVARLSAKPFVGHLENAKRLTETHPHRIWFPQNPLITYYADGKLWHSEDGVETRFLANYGIREADFRRYLPPGLEGVAYRADINSPFSMALLSEFSREIKGPFWTLYVRPMRQLEHTQK
jgi:hypothetical protein